MRKPPVVLSIAGSDCSSGAGIQADLKAFSYFGTHGLTAVTCVVAESPHRVVSIHPVPPAILQDQIRVLKEDFTIAAVKTGMLYSKAHIVAVSELLENVDAPIVVDPVMVATSGSSLLRDDAIEAYRSRLLPLCSLITPNLPEASVLLGKEISKVAQLESAAEEISTLFGTSCLLKGGHLPASETRIDVLWHEGKAQHFSAPTLDIPSTHGTGCTLSAAIAANLAKGLSPSEAVRISKKWVHHAISDSFLLSNKEGRAVYALNQLRDESL